MKRVLIFVAMTVVLLLGNGAQAGVSLVMNGSFENDGRQILDITVEAPTHWCDVSIPSDKFGGYVNDLWSSHGEYSLSLYSMVLGTYQAGNMATISQEVDLTDVGQIIFDMILTTDWPDYVDWDPNKFSVFVRLGTETVWDSNNAGISGNGEYHVEIGGIKPEDVNGPVLSLGIKANQSLSLEAISHIVRLDFVKFDAHCGGLGYLPEDLNHDCYVDIADLEILAGRWLAEERNQKYDLFQDDEAIVNFHDFAIFASYWQDNTCQQPESCGGSDFDRSGTVDFADFTIFAGHWLRRVPGLSDLNGDGVVNFKDFARLGNRWRDNTDWKNWGDDNCFEVELPAADLNDDGVVNWRDFAILAGDWMGEGSCIRADIDSSGVVDYGDLSKLADQWLLKSWLYGLE